MQKNVHLEEVNCVSVIGIGNEYPMREWCEHETKAPSPHQKPPGISSANPQQRAHKIPQILLVRDLHQIIKVLFKTWSMLVNHPNLDDVYHHPDSNPL